MNDSTFDIFAQPAKTPDALADLPISDAQVRQLRDAFAGAGINSMDERRAIIESCTVRPVTTIRDLLGRDVRLVLRRIKERSCPSKPGSGSAWDNRDEETWIDKL